MKKNYSKPETEITRFEAVDVITTSGIGTNTNSGFTNFVDLWNSDNNSWTHNP